MVEKLADGERKEKCAASTNLLRVGYDFVALLGAGQVDHLKLFASSAEIPLCRWLIVVGTCLLNDHDDDRNTEKERERERSESY